MSVDVDAAERTGRECAIELVEVGKDYANVRAVDGFSLEIDEGEFVVLLGPSGCGKSTLLKMIAGLELASAGEIYISGELANYIAPKQRNVAMVFQNYALYPHKTVAENIGFPLKMRRVAKQEIRERVSSVIGMLELREEMEKYPGQLSGGQRQRVALGRALIRDPVAFLLDEPLSNLDAVLRTQMREELIQLHQRLERAMVYVTHDQIEALTMADRIVVMDRGRIQQVAAPRELYDAPGNLFVASFVGSPQMNRVPGRVVEVKGRRSIVSLVGTFSVGRGVELEVGEDVTVGVRPEAFGIGDPASTGVVGTVGVVEVIGADAIVHVSIEEQLECLVRVGGQRGIDVGREIGLRAEEVHVFDRDGVRVAGAFVGEDAKRGNRRGGVSV